MCACALGFYCFDDCAALWAVAAVLILLNPVALDSHRNVHVTHNKLIKYVSPPHPGATNDKTMVRHDALVQAMRSDPMFRDFSFQLQGVKGTR